jgi:ribonuclease HI
MSEIVVYTDGSGNSFGNDGGYGWRIVIDGQHYKDGSGYIPNSTNNVAELTAVAKGLSAVKNYISILPKEGVHKITLISDSQLALGYTNGKYMCKAMHLRDLYIQVRKLAIDLKIDTKWERGHIGEPNNTAVDHLAGEARALKQGLDDETT